MKPIASIEASTLVRFWSKVDKSGACWLWTAAKNNHGYGSFWDGRTQQYAHRFSFFLANGYLPAELDHLCRTPACVHPLHLEDVSHLENMGRGYFASKTHCVNGHQFTPENTYLTRRTGKNGVTRRCKTCQNAREAAKRQPVVRMTTDERQESARASKRRWYEANKDRVMAKTKAYNSTEQGKKTIAEWRQRKLVEMTADPHHKYHGKTSGYTTGCRCEPCVEAGRENGRRYRAAKRSETA